MSNVSSAKNSPDYPAFQILDKSYASVDVSNMEVKGLPQVRSQDGLPTCAAWSAWALYGQYQCHEEGKCYDKMSSKDIPAPLYFSVYSKDTLDEIPSANFKGSNAGKVLIHFKTNGVAMSDSCIGFDQFIANHKGDAKETVEFFKKLKSEYDRSKTEGSACMDCLSNALKDLGLKNDNATILKALSASTFDKFLYEFTLGSCRDGVEITKMFSIYPWPDDDHRPSYDETLSKIKDLLGKGRAIETGVCLTEVKKVNDCSSAHSFVIAGYRKFCKPSGECREALKIHNSWGQDWQNENNDGWVDAKTLYNHMKEDTRFLTYIEPKGA